MRPVDRQPVDRLRPSEAMYESYATTHPITEALDRAVEAL
jgi:hypothetical protein